MGRDVQAQSRLRHSSAVIPLKSGIQTFSYEEPLPLTKNPCVPQ